MLYAAGVQVLRDERPSYELVVSIDAMQNYKQEDSGVFQPLLGGSFE